jgi:hypothetical protein
LGQTNSPPTISKAAKSAAASVISHTDDQFPERNGVVEDRTTAINAK